LEKTQVLIKTKTFKRNRKINNVKHHLNIKNKNTDQCRSKVIYSRGKVLDFIYNPRHNTIPKICFCIKWCITDFL